MYGPEFEEYLGDSPEIVSNVVENVFLRLLWKNMNMVDILALWNNETMVLLQLIKWWYL